MGIEKADYAKYEFYNPKSKIKFIESRSTEYRNYAIRYMCITAGTEKRMGKDLSKFNRGDVISMLESIGYYSYSSVDKLLTCIKMYLTWYEAETREDVSGGVLNMSSSEVDISTGASQIFVKDSDEIVDMIPDFPPENGYFFVPFLLLVWAGYDSSQISELRDCDVVMDREMPRVSVSFLGKDVVFNGKSAKAFIDYYYFEDSVYGHVDKNKRPFRKTKYDDLFFYRYSYRKNVEKPLTGDVMRRNIGLKIKSGEIPKCALNTSIALSGRMYVYYQDMLKSGANELTDSIIKMSHNSGEQPAYYRNEKKLFESYRKKFNL